MEACIGRATGKPQHRGRMLYTVGVRHKTILDEDPDFGVGWLGHDEMGRIDHECLLRPGHRYVAAGQAREMKKQIVVVSLLCPHDIRDNPILRREEEDPALVDRVILVAARHAPEIVVVGARDLLFEFPVRLRALYLEAVFAQRVPRLILLVDLHGVVIARAAEEHPPIRAARFVVDIATGIDDQRLAIRRHLETQQIQMAVVPPAQRPTIEHEVALVLERLRSVPPAAAQNMIATVRKPL